MNKDEIVELIPFIKDWVRFVGYRYKVPGIGVAVQLKDDLLLDFAFCALRIGFYISIHRVPAGAAAEGGRVGFAA